MRVHVKVTMWKEVELPKEMSKKEAIKILERTEKGLCHDPPSH